MDTKDKMIEILNNSFNNIINSVQVDYKQSAQMKNVKHIELVERYAKVLSHHYVGKFAHLCTTLLSTSFLDSEHEQRIMNKFENKMNEVTNGFDKDMNTALKSIKKYFGHAYSVDCLTNVTAECFLDDINAEKQIFLDWAENLDVTPEIPYKEPNEKVSA